MSSPPPLCSRRDAVIVAGSGRRGDEEASCKGLNPKPYDPEHGLELTFWEWISLDLLGVEGLGFRVLGVSGFKRIGLNPTGYFWGLAQVGGGGVRVGHRACSYCRSM